MSAYAQLNLIKHRLAVLHIRDAEADQMIERGHRLKAEVAVEIEAAESELASAVAAPLECDEDPTGWLPNELMIMVLLHVVFLEECRSVCKRWHVLCRDHQLKTAMGLSRWKAYADGRRTPQTVTGHTDWVYALAVGKEGKVYSGSCDNTVKVWSGSTGALLQTLQGHTNSVRALAIGHDGNVYSGSYDCTVKVWSGHDGALVRTLVGHRSTVYSLAVDSLHLYSGSSDDTIRVWVCSTAECVHTLRGHTGYVRALALDNRGKLLYSGSSDQTIRVWTTSEHTHIRTLSGHTSEIWSMAVGRDGTLFSGSSDKTIKCGPGRTATCCGPCTDIRVEC
eukprot:m.357590 g.357590  ORF g.357590 m.357590 type:complete len:336 (-) comp16616_c1_seq4:1730-2737(-)